MLINYPPHPIQSAHDHKSVFLGGSIEMGNAIDWQLDIIEMCKESPIIFYNPRRPDWNSSWEQSIVNANFRDQVDWELHALEEAHKIVMYFDPSTKSPISLLELGLHARSQKLLVCCPDGFWRKGNVVLTCRKYHIPMFHSLIGIADVLNKMHVRYS